MRIELAMSILAGFAGGLTGTLWGGMISSPLLAAVRAIRPQDCQPESASRLLAGAVLYGACGGAAGFLFWLSWGLVGIVDASWPAIGVIFGSLLWCAAPLPALGVLSMRLASLRRVAFVQMLEALAACLAIGLLCSFVWHRSS